MTAHKVNSKVVEIEKLITSAYGPVPSAGTNPELQLTTDLSRSLGHLERVGCTSTYTSSTEMHS